MCGGSLCLPATPRPTSAHLYLTKCDRPARFVGQTKHLLPPLQFTNAINDLAVHFRSAVGPLAPLVPFSIYLLPIPVHRVSYYIDVRLETTLSCHVPHGIPSCRFCEAFICWCVSFNPNLDLDSRPYPFHQLSDLLNFHPTPVRSCTHPFPFGSIWTTVAVGSETPGNLVPFLPDSFSGIFTLSNLTLTFKYVADGNHLP